MQKWCDRPLTFFISYSPYSPIHFFLPYLFPPFHLFCSRGSRVRVLGAALVHGSRLFYCQAEQNLVSNLLRGSTCFGWGSAVQLSNYLGWIWCHFLFIIMYCMVGINYIIFFEFGLTPRHFQNVFTVIVERREQVPFCIDIQNGELMHDCSPEPLGMGTVRLK